MKKLLNFAKQKKVLLKTVVAMLIAVLIIPGAFAASNFVYGDVTDDGLVDASDLVRLKKYLAGMDVTLGPESGYVISTMNGATVLKNQYQINDGFSDTAASAAHMQMNKNGICFVSYLAGENNSYGECRGHIKLSVFPYRQPWKSEVYTIAKADGVFESNCLLISDTVCRVFYFNADRCYCYRDFDLTSRTVSAESKMYIGEASGEDANQKNKASDLQDGGYNYGTPSSSGDRVRLPQYTGNQLTYTVSGIRPNLTWVDSDGYYYNVGWINEGSAVTVSASSYNGQTLLSNGGAGRVFDASKTVGYLLHFGYSNNRACTASSVNADSSVTIKIFDIGSAPAGAKTLCPSTLESYLSSKGITANFSYGPIFTCIPVKKGAYHYAAVSGFGTPIIFVRSNDGFASMEYLGVINARNYYECQISYSESDKVWYILTRNDEKPNAAISIGTSADLKSFSSFTEIKDSAKTRPLIMQYKGYTLLVVNKATNVTGKVGGKYDIYYRSRIVGMKLNPNDVNNSEVLFDLSSRYGMMYPAIVERMNELFMVFSDSSTFQQSYNTSDTDLSGKDDLCFLALGELQSNVKGETFTIK